MGRFLSQKDMLVAKHELEIFNSKMNRNEIENPETINRLHHSVCSCGTEGCIGIIAQHKNKSIVNVRGE